MRRYLAAAATALLFASPALAAEVTAHDGAFEADVSTRQMSRIDIPGEKIAAIRKLDEPNGPQMQIEVDEASGDAFVAFDGDVQGRSYTAFLTTQSGKVVQAVLRPVPGPGQTIIVRLGGGPAPAAGVSGGAAPQAIAAETPIAPGRGQYQENLVQFVRAMFSDHPAEGVMRRVVLAPTDKVGPFAIREVTDWRADGLVGRVLYITNVSKAEQTVPLSAFAVEHVYAVAETHETLRPGEQGRIFIVEGGQ